MDAVYEFWNYFLKLDTDYAKQALLYFTALDDLNIRGNYFLHGSYKLSITKLKGLLLNILNMDWLKFLHLLLSWFVKKNQRMRNHGRLL